MNEWSEGFVYGVGASFTAYLIVRLVIALIRREIAAAKGDGPWGH